MGHVDDESVGKHHPLEASRLQLHYVRNFVPSEADESRVVFRNVGNFDDHVRLKIGLPLHLKKKKKKRR